MKNYKGDIKMNREKYISIHFRMEKAGFFPILKLIYFHSF